MMNWISQQPRSGSLSRAKQSRKRVSLSSDTLSLEMPDRVLVFHETPCLSAEKDLRINLKVIENLGRFSGIRRPKTDPELRGAGGVPFLVRFE